MAGMHANFPKVHYILRVKTKGHVLKGHLKATFGSARVFSLHLLKSGLWKSLSLLD